MFFYKQYYTNIGTGDTEGFTPNCQVTPGYGIEFDTWQNIPEDFQMTPGIQQNPIGDPSPQHIALIEDFTGNHLTYVNDSRVDDDTWHSVSVTVDSSSVTVYIDQGLALQWTGELNRTYDGFGFSGATGCATDWHIIGNFSITATNLQTPALTTSCTTSVSPSSLNVLINGNLTYNGTSIPNAPVLLYYSVTGGESWQDLTLVDTDSTGAYSAMWLPQVTGNYQLKAIYQGNENYLGTSNTVNFVMEPYTEQGSSVFSITSNSTLSDLSFNSTSEEIAFTVSGPTGTRGYVQVCIPKTLIADITGLTVSLDDNQIQYTAQTQNNNWILYFTYHHSTHSVTINFGTNKAKTPNASTQKQPELQAQAIVLAISLLTVSSLLILKQKNRLKQKRSKVQ